VRALLVAHGALRGPPSFLARVGSARSAHRDGRPDQGQCTGHRSSGGRGGSIRCRRRAIRKALLGGGTGHGGAGASGVCLVVSAELATVPRPFGPKRLCGRRRRAPSGADARAVAGRMAGLRQVLLGPVRRPERAAAGLGLRCLERDGRDRPDRRPSGRMADAPTRRTRQCPVDAVGACVGLAGCGGSGTAPLVHHDHGQPGAADVFGALGAEPADGNRPECLRPSVQRSRAACVGGRPADHRWARTGAHYPAGLRTARHAERGGGAGPVPTRGRYLRGRHHPTLVVPRRSGRGYAGRPGRCDLLLAVPAADGCGLFRVPSPAR